MAHMDHKKILDGLRPFYNGSCTDPMLVSGG